MTALPKDQRFRPQEHVRRGADFQRAFQRKRSSANDWLIVYACENGLPHARLGMSVGRKWGGAVVRNRMRRLYREMFRLSKHELPAGVDLILVPRTAKLPPLAEMVQAFPRVVRSAARKLEHREARPLVIAVLSRILSLMLIALVFVYRGVIRPMLPPLCKFEPSCSEYFIQAVKKDGPICGAAKGAWRVCRCNPWSFGGYDPP